MRSTSHSGRKNVRDYDPFAVEMVADPYPVYERFRSDSPVFRSGRLGVWVLTRYQDCRAVLDDAQRFAAVTVPGFDPPEHTAVRRLFAAAMRNQDLDCVGRCAVGEAVETYRRLAAAESFDLTAEVARPVALAALCRLLGVEPPPVAEFAPLSDALAQGLDADLQGGGLGPALAARIRVNELMADRFAERRESGLLEQVLGSASAAGVSRSAVWHYVRALFHAGFSATVAAAANAALTLLIHPAALQRMYDPAALESGVDELLRFDPPVQAATRACTERTVLGGTVIKEGELVRVLIGAANRDPRQFDRPHELVPDRRPNRHLALAWGSPGCSGTLLARIVLRALIVSLLKAPGPLCPAAPAVRVPRATLRYPDVLPVTFRPVDSQAFETEPFAADVFVGA
jgi:cytochrome P450